MTLYNGFLDVLMRGVELAAIIGSVVRRLEGNLRFLPAVCADGGEHLSRCSRSVLLRVSAGLASLRLVLLQVF